MVIGCTGHKVNADSNVVKEYSTFLPQRFVLVNADSNVVKEYSTFLPQRFVLVNADSNVVKEYSAGEVSNGTASSQSFILRNNSHA